MEINLNVEFLTLQIVELENRNFFFEDKERFNNKVTFSTCYIIFLQR